MTEVRPERPEEIAGIRAVHIAAFETADEAGLVEARRASDAWVPDLSVVAVSLLAVRNLLGVVLLVAAAREAWRASSAAPPTSQPYDEPSPTTATRGQPAK